MASTVAYEQKKGIHPQQAYSPLLLPRRKAKKSNIVEQSFRAIQSLPPLRGSCQSRSMTPGLPKCLSPSLQEKSPSISPKPPRKRITQEQAVLNSLKNYRLPARFPGQFQTCLNYKNEKGEDIPLLHRDQVARVLRRLDRDVQPLLSKFNLLYAAVSESHPQLPKAAYTCKIPLRFEVDVPVFAHYILIRVRSRTNPNDVSKFYNRSSLQAVFFHELAHLRHMNHEVEFALFLRDIYRYARKHSIFLSGEVHQVPSCRPWENLLFEAGGNVSDEELIALHQASTLDDSIVQT